MRMTTKTESRLTDIAKTRRKVLSLLDHRAGTNRSTHDPIAVRRRLLLADMLTDQAERIVRFCDSRL